MNRDQNNPTGHGAEQFLDLADAYVWDALDEASRQAFELELAENQVAREAVAQAVELANITRAAVQADLRSAESMTPAKEIRPASQASARSWDWAVGISVVSLLALFLVLSPLVSVQPSDETSPPGDSELAVIWSDMISQPAEEAEGSLEPEETLAEFVEGDALVADSPDWMLAAVVQLSAKNDMDREIDMENR